MKKSLLLVLAFLLSSAFIMLTGTQYLSLPGKLTIIVFEAVIILVSLVDKTFLTREKRAELRKVIDDMPS
ncbi:MAG: hypothetical protein IT250_07765 [Chitinophagaceae bacterium]|nr:hypothetical protein [Chitinophagaceae bacterium]